MNVCALQKVRDLLGGDAFPKCESASLRLEKYVRVGDNTKKEEIEVVVSKSQGRIPLVVPKRAVSFTAKLGGRLIVNQAGGVLENAGLCIHSHFNAPYIPGSAIKGCARHAAWQAWADAEAGEGKIAAAKEVAEIFGYPTGDRGLDKFLAEKCNYKNAQSGKVVFLAAVPETTAKLVVDIVNCHHKDYYAGKETKPYATDDEAPIPNFFPAVEAGAFFKFTIVPVGVHNLTERALHWLKIGLSQHGIGAKTAAGYGWFDIPDDKTEISVDESFLEYLRSNYLKEGKPRAEAFKKDYKRGNIVADTDEKKRALCQYLGDYKIKIGGEWQQDINRMFKEFGMEVL